MGFRPLRWPVPQTVFINNLAVVGAAVINAGMSPISSQLDLTTLAMKSCRHGRRQDEDSLLGRGSAWVSSALSCASSMTVRPTSA